MAIRHRRVVLGAALLLTSGLLASGPVGWPGAGASQTRHQGPVDGLIAFSTGFIQPDPDLGEHSQVYTVKPDGTEIRQLTHVPGGSEAGDPDWSPDGSHIAYVDNQSGDFAVMVMNADGSDQHLVARSPNWDYFMPRWSPDGTQLAVVRCQKINGYEIACDIDLMRSDGTGRHILVGSHVMNQNPDWSPDGSHIVFSSDRAGLVQALWVADLDATHQHLVGLHRLTQANVEATYPQWSPLGNRILFGDNFDRPQANVFTVRPDGGRIHQVTGVGAGLASWSPDGRHLVLISGVFRDSRGSDLLTARANGTDLTPVVTHHPHVTYSDWGTYAAAPKATRAERSAVR